MITEVELRVTLQLDADAPQAANKIKLAAKQAVSNALQFAYDNGFEHSLADDVSIGVADVEVIGINAKCARCGGDLDTQHGYCIDGACPFSDHQQDCPAGWTGHPEHKAGPCNCKR